MNDRYGDKVSSIETYLNKLPRIEEKSKGNLYYRGQGDCSYGLQPSIFRGNYLEKEHIIYSEVMTECGHEFEKCVLHNEKLSKMQHYGVPTRLLDITSNALVALYFACEDYEATNNDGTKKDGAIFVIDAKKSEIKQFDSDTVSILASLPRFTLDEKKEMELRATSFADMKDSEKNLKTFNNKNTTIRRLLHEIKKEKPSFEHVIKPENLLRNYIFIPRKSNVRIIRQSGAFIIFGLNKGEEKKSDFTYEKIIVDGNAKAEILKQLSSFGINKASIYPELYKVAEHIKEKYK